jgi:hypothetical protein
MKLGMDEEQAESRRPAGKISALRRVQRTASSSLPHRMVRFRTLDLPLPTPPERNLATRHAAVKTGFRLEKIELFAFARPAFGDSPRSRLRNHAP